MFVTNILVNERAAMICSFLPPHTWPRLCGTTKRMTEALSQVVLRSALVAMLTQTSAQLQSTRTPSKDDFSRIEDALRLISRRLPHIELVQRELADLVNVVSSWLGGCEGRLRSVSGETTKVPKLTRSLLRGTDPRLWITAAQTFPSLYLSVCKVILRWPLNYKDRLELLDANAVILPKLAVASDPKSVAVGCQLSVMLSCGCEQRVARLEREMTSARAVEALKQHSADDDVVIAALGYLYNVAQCEEQWPTLVQLGVRPLCINAQARLHDHPMVKEYVKYLLDVLHFMEYDSDAQ
jgi:hypothetical protein